MEDFRALTQFRPEDLSAHAVSLAVLTWALDHAQTRDLSQAAFHRAAELALALYREEERRLESLDCPAPLLDQVYLKAFLPVSESEDAAGSGAIASRFHSEMRRLVTASDTSNGGGLAPLGLPSTLCP